MYLLCLIAVSVFTCTSFATETGDITAFVTGLKIPKRGGIHRVNITGDSFHTLKITVGKEGQPTALAIDDVNGRIYWSNLRSKEISSARMDGSDQRLLVKYPKNGQVHGLSVDPVANLLFYTDSINSLIQSVSIENTSTPEVIINTKLYRPEGIVAYYEKGILIWTNRVRYAGIEKSNYNGSERTAIVRYNTVTPEALTLDKTSDTVYWCDSDTKKVESIKLDGTKRKVILHEPVSAYESVFFFEGLVYLVDFLTNDLQLISRKGKKVKVMTFEVFGHNGGVAVTRLPSCPDGVYGYDCNSTCGHCLDNSLCNRIDGTCVRGCQEGWTSFRCDQVKPNETETENETSGATQQMMTSYIIFTVFLATLCCPGNVLR